MHLPAALGTALNGTAAGTGFIVFQNRGNSSTGSTTRNGGAWQFGTQGNSNHFGAAGATGSVADDLYDDFGSNTRPFIGDYVTPTSPTIGPNLYTASSVSGTFNARVDGVQRLNAAQGTAFRAVPTIGGDKATTRYNGDVAEVVVYGRNLNTAERVVVENYLSAKWGTTLLEGAGALDVYKGDDGANGNYDFDVFGIGSLAGGSTATSTGTAGFGMEVTSVLSSGDFLLAGHQAGANSLIPSGSGERWSSVWYVDRTNTTGMTANLSFDFNNAGLGAFFDPIKTYELLYSSTSTLSFLASPAIATVSGTTITFDLSNAELLDGYYTLQVNPVPPAPEPATLGILGLALSIVVVRRRRTSLERQPGEGVE